MNAREALTDLVENADPDALPDLVGELARAQALVQARLQANGSARPEPTPTDRDADRLLDVEAAAELLSVDTRWLYRRADKLPFTRKLSPRTLRFSERGMLRWLETRK